MKLMKNITAVVGCAALALSPVVAQAADSAASLSVADYSQARGSADIENANELEAGAGAIIGIILAVIAIGWIIYEVADDNPTSP